MLKIEERTWEQTVMNSDKPVLVDFWAAWCGPCKVLAPILDTVEQELGDVVTFAKVNTEFDSVLARKNGISSIPTLVLFKDGKELARFSGVRTKEFIIHTITENLRLAKD